MKAIGIIVLVVGLALTIFTSVNFFTKEKVVDLGKVEITKDKPNFLSWSPIIGIVVMGIGGVVIMQGSRK